MTELNIAAGAVGAAIGLIWIGYDHLKSRIRKLENTVEYLDKVVSRWERNDVAQIIAIRSEK